MAVFDLLPSRRAVTLSLALSLSLASPALAFPYNTFDGPGFPACHDVAKVVDATSVDEMMAVVKAAAATPGTLVRASGKGHMWYDTMCSDPGAGKTVIVRTEGVHGIYDLDMAKGTVTVEAGVTFFQLADWLHARGACIGYTLVNWNITLAGAVAMGAHRSSLKEHANVAAGVLSMDIIDGTGTIRTVVRDESDDTWLAASTSLGLLGIIARMTMRVYPDFKLAADQRTLDEKAVLDGNIGAMIEPYETANLWWWPFMRKFHQRFYWPVPANTSDQEGFQSTFSVTELEGHTARVLLDSGKYLPSSNALAESIFFGIWNAHPNFHDKRTNEAILSWPVYGWNYDVLIGGLYPDQKPEWDYDLHGYTMELAFPMTIANKVLKRVRQLFDDELKRGIVMASTYRSGINIKFGKAYFDLLGQTTVNTTDGADWSRGVMMFDFPSYRPTVGDHKRFNEEFCERSRSCPGSPPGTSLLTVRFADTKVATTLVNEFPCRPHWTKNTREVLRNAVKNLDPTYLARFKAVREQFDPKGIFKSVVGEIIGVS